jgi:hypothetical protein
VYAPFLPRLSLKAELIYTLCRAKTRIQAIPADGKGKGKDNRSMLSVLLRIYKKEGVFGLYRGFGATMLNTFSMRALQVSSHCPSVEVQ